MPDRAEEDRLARFVENLWRHEMGREPGKPDYEPSDRGFTVDFIYPHASPPIALEITTLPSPQAKAAGSAGDKTLAFLDKAAKDESLGRWELLWNTTDNVTKLREQVLVRMRSGSAGGMSPYTGWWVRPIDDPEHGIQSVMIDHNRRPSGASTGVLTDVALANIDKLRATKPEFETHLAVEAHWGLIDRNHHEIIVPDDPGLRALDWLWVLPRVGSNDEPTAWWARPGAKRWNTSHVAYEAQ